MSETVCDIDFSDIADSEILTATQSIEQNVGISQFAKIEFSDVPDATQRTVNLSSADAYNVEFSDISDAELIQVADFEPTMRFRRPVSSAEMDNIAGEKFAKRTR
jgi:hypothetical protein